MTPFPTGPHRVVSSFGGGPLEGGWRDGAEPDYGVLLTAPTLSNIMMVRTTAKRLSD